MPILAEAAIVLIIIGVVAFVALVWGLSAHFEAKRRKQLAAYAAGKGLSFRPAEDPGIEARFSEFDCLTTGRSRSAKNVMTGELFGLPVTAFDYRYVTGYGRSQTTHNFSVVAMESPVPLEPLLIRREGFFDKIKAVFGHNDIDFDDAPEFSKRFYVQAPDEPWARAVLDRNMQEFLMAGPQYAVQFGRRHVMVWRPERRCKGPDYDAAIEFACGVLDRLPEDVLNRQSEGAVDLPYAEPGETDKPEGPRE